MKYYFCGYYLCLVDEGRKEKLERLSPKKKQRIPKYLIDADHFARIMNCPFTNELSCSIQCPHFNLSDDKNKAILSCGGTERIIPLQKLEGEVVVNNHASCRACIGAEFEIVKFKE